MPFHTSPRDLTPRQKRTAAQQRHAHNAHAINNGNNRNVLAGLIATYRAGQILLADVTFDEDAKRSKIRPVLAVESKGDFVAVRKITTNHNPRFNSEIVDPESAGLRRGSALSHKVVTIRANAVIKHLAQISAPLLTVAETAAA